MPLLSEIIFELEKFAPLQWQEKYDNSGLLVGYMQQEINGAILCLDCIEAVVDEAIAQQCNLIIAHHPILFSGLKSLTGKNYIEKTILKAIKNNIAIYAAHTNLDNVYDGVNFKIAEKLKLKNVSILAPTFQSIKQLYVYVPNSHVANVRNALFEAGAGNIGQNYTECSFNTEGVGTFKPNENAQPFLGKKNILQKENETKIEVVYTINNERKILNALEQSHPYEEIAYGIVTLENKNKQIGAGVVGELENEMDEKDFLHVLKTNMQINCIRHTHFLNKKIKTVALCGGSGSFLLPQAIAKKAHIFTSADFKYHQFFDANQQIIIADIGHYESEQFTSEIFYDVLSKKFLNFALRFTNVNTNPINYYL